MQIKQLYYIYVLNLKFSHHTYTEFKPYAMHIEMFFLKYSLIVTVPQVFLQITNHHFKHHSNSIFLNKNKFNNIIINICIAIIKIFFFHLAV